MPKRFPFTHREGTHSRQAHADLPAEAPYEREMGRAGFYGPATHLHHRHPPTGWTSWEGEPRPHAYDLLQLDAEYPVPWDAPPVLHNTDCQLRLWRCADAMPRPVRNADGDTLLFTHAGQGDLFCDFGHLGYREGDYLVIPRGTLWRLEPGAPSTFLVVDATDQVLGLPDKGFAGAHAVFDPAVPDLPAIDEAFIAQQDENEWQVVIRHGDQRALVTFPFNPLDAAGWHGEVCVRRLNWRDIRPLTSPRFHLPPSVHTTFAAEHFVVCTFVPRPLETDPGALKVPFYHSNDDYDEVIFYHAGEFFSRDNIRPGMLTFHPRGFTHGPHPGAYRAAMRGGRTETSEVAVMIDTRQDLRPGKSAHDVEWTGYIDSWRDDGNSA